MKTAGGGIRGALLAAAFAAALSGAGHARAAEPPPVVAAAADLQFALAEIAAAYGAAGGGPVRLALGSSGNFARQIRQGAPFEIFLSADEAYVLALARDGFAQGQGALYARGRIALLVPRGSPLKPDGTLADLAAALQQGRVGKFAIANPEHAPYGRRAQEALESAGLWDALKPRLVLGENASQAAQFAASGNATGGIVAYSLALAPPLRDLAAHALIAEDRHAPLLQRMALLKNARPAAERFFAYLQSPAARAIFRRHGFTLPDEGG